MFASDRTMAAVASASAAARSFSVEMVSEVWSSRKAVSSPSVSQFCSLIRFVKLTLVIRMLLRNAIASLSPPSGGLLLFQFREDAGESRAHPFQVLANDDLEVLFGTRQLLEVGAEPPGGDGLLLVLAVPAGRLSGAQLIEMRMQPAGVPMNARQHRLAVVIEN